MIRIEVREHGEIVDRLFSGERVSVGQNDDCDIVVGSARGARFVEVEIRIVGSRCVVLPRGFVQGLDEASDTTSFIELGEEFMVGPASLRIVEFGPDEKAPEQVRPCLNCGAVIAFEAKSCPHCSYEVPRDRNALIHRWRIKGYELRRKIGGGGMGIVFEALRYDDGKAVAVKILRPELASQPSYMVRFVEEIRALIQLNHPHIVQVHRRGLQGNLAWIDMELVRGPSVRSIVRRSGPLPEERALRIVWEVTLALDFAEKKKIIHGDVKPSNFLIDHTGRAKLCDFGLAFMAAGSGGSLGKKESSGRKGTAAYAAPELLASRRPPTVQSDMFAMGVSLYQLLTGELPFGSSGFADPEGREPQSPDLLARRTDLRPATAMLVERLLHADPLRRYATYRALQDDLALLTS